MADKLPEGYIAVDENADVYAVDSETLVENGEVHAFVVERKSTKFNIRIPTVPLIKYPIEIITNNGNYGNILDSKVELDISDEVRQLKQLAHGYKEKFGNPESPDYIKDTHDREAKLTGLIIDDIAHHKELGGGIIKQGDALTVYRNAAVTSAMLHEAGVPNHLVHSGVDITSDRIQFKKGQYRFDGKHDSTVGHMYVVTDDGNAIVDPIYADTPYQDQAYMIISNDVEVKDIVLDGKTALAIAPTSISGYVTAYGGHDGSGKIDEATYIASVEDAIKDHNSYLRDRNRNNYDTDKKVTEALQMHTRSDKNDHITGQELDAMHRMASIVADNQHPEFMDSLRRIATYDAKQGGDENSVSEEDLKAMIKNAGMTVDEKDLGLEDIPLSEPTPAAAPSTDTSRSR